MILLNQYVFSNVDKKQTAIRDCDAYNLYHEEQHLIKPATKTEPPRRRTPDEMKKAYRSFQQTIKRSKTVVECFLQHAYYCHSQEYHLFLTASNMLERSSSFNELFYVSWKSFQSKLKTTNRKRKLNNLTASSIYNNIHGKNSTNYLMTLRAQCGLQTHRKKKMKWTFTLPSISLITINEETPPLMVEDIIDERSNSETSNSETSSNNSSLPPQQHEQVNNVVDASSNYGFELLYC